MKYVYSKFEDRYASAVFNTLDECLTDALNNGYIKVFVGVISPPQVNLNKLGHRSEERRVGKEC